MLPQRVGDSPLVDLHSKAPWFGRVRERLCRSWCGGWPVFYVVGRLAEQTLLQLNGVDEFSKNGLPFYGKLSGRPSSAEFFYIFNTHPYRGGRGLFAGGYLSVLRNRIEKKLRKPAHSLAGLGPECQKLSACLSWVPNVFAWCTAHRDSFKTLVDHPM